MIQASKTRVENLKNLDKLEKPVRNKHSSLVGPSVSYKESKIRELLLKGKAQYS
jgi:hypothetical protein